MKKQTVLAWFISHPAINLSEFARECGFKTAFYIREQLGDEAPDELRPNFEKKILPVLKRYGFKMEEQK